MARFITTYLVLFNALIESTRCGVFRRTSHARACVRTIDGRAVRELPNSRFRLSLSLSHNLLIVGRERSRLSSLFEYEMQVCAPRARQLSDLLWSYSIDAQGGRPAVENAAIAGQREASDFSNVSSSCGSAVLKSRLKVDVHNEKSGEMMDKPSTKAAPRDFDTSKFPTRRVRTSESSLSDLEELYRVNGIRDCVLELSPSGHTARAFLDAMRSAVDNTDITCDDIPDNWTLDFLSLSPLLPQPLKTHMPRPALKLAGIAEAQPEPRERAQTSAERAFTSKTLSMHISRILSMSEPALDLSPSSPFAPLGPPPYFAHHPSGANIQLNLQLESSSSSSRNLSALAVSTAVPAQSTPLRMLGTDTVDIEDTSCGEVGVEIDVEVPRTALVVVETAKALYFGKFLRGAALSSLLNPALQKGNEAHSRDVHDGAVIPRQRDAVEVEVQAPPGDASETARSMPNARLRWSSRPRSIIQSTEIGRESLTAQAANEEEEEAENDHSLSRRLKMHRSSLELLSAEEMKRLWSERPFQYSAATHPEIASVVINILRATVIERRRESECRRAGVVSLGVDGRTGQEAVRDQNPSGQSQSQPVSIKSVPPWSEPVPPVLLDPCCGSGTSLAYALRAGFRVVGRDTSRRVVEGAARNLHYMSAFIGGDRVLQLSAQDSTVPSRFHRSYAQQRDRCRDTETETKHSSALISDKAMLQGGGEDVGCDEAPCHAASTEAAPTAAAGFPVSEVDCVFANLPWGKNAFEFFGQNKEILSVLKAELRSKVPCAFIMHTEPTARQRSSQQGQSATRPVSLIADASSCSSSNSSSPSSETRVASLSDDADGDDVSDDSGAQVMWETRRGKSSVGSNAAFRSGSGLGLGQGFRLTLEEAGFVVEREVVVAASGAYRKSDAFKDAQECVIFFAHTT